MINRRTFLESACLGAAALKGAGVPTASATITQPSAAQTLKRLNPRNVKLNVKLVFGAMVHSGMWEGPCRWDVQKTPDEERAALQAQYRKTIQESRKRLSGDVCLLAPVYHEYSEKLEATIGQEFFDQLARDSDDTDLYLIHGNVFAQYFYGVIGRRFRRPTAMLGNLINTEGAAYLRSIGVEGYAPENYEELNRLISVLRARKVFQQTSIVYPTDLGRRLKRNVSCISDFEDLKSRFGITTTIVPFKELASEVSGVERDEAKGRLAEEITTRVVAAARKCDIDRKYVLSDARFSVALRSLLAKHHGNAFTIECREFCASRLAQDWKACPCLHHSLMKSAGYASACEGDINALLSMQMLMAISNKAAYMGNLNPKDEEHVRLGHEVPAIKMNGFDAPDLPYELRNFILAGWGTKMQIEMDKVGEKTATFARLDPTAQKILIAKGEVVGCEGFREPGCALVAVLRVPGARELLKRRADYGFHFAMVYGDYASQMADLSRLLKLEVSTFNV